jgi:hypothetical protein
MWRWKMLAALLTLAVAAPAAETANEGVRAVTVAVYTKKAVPAENLEPRELSVKENGEKRAVLAVKRDHRALDVALIVDSSGALGPLYRQHLVDAAMAFRKAAPEEARVAIWTSGGAPSKIVGFETDDAAAEEALKMVAAGGKNYTLDTIIDASRDLRSERAARRVVAVVTNTDVEATRTLIQRTFRVVGHTGVVPMVILIKAGGKPAQGWDSETLFEKLGEGYGGTYEAILTPMAATRRLERVALDLASQYQVRYASDADETTFPKVKVERKGVEVRAGASQGVRTVRSPSRRTAQLESR